MCRNTFLFLLTVFFSNFVLAEGGCPPGYYPQQGQGWQNCVPIPRAGGGGDQSSSGAYRPVAIWATRWGAIASDPNGPLGIAESQKSQRLAKKTAISDCVARGGKKSACEIRMIYKNQCAAYAWGGGMGTAQGAYPQSEAERLAINHCNTTGGSNCELIYSGCSMAELVGYR